MLESITINNIALIENLTINFKKGLNVLSGETGAGKSLIIDSLSLLLGERADKSLISFGKDYASVEAVFETDNKSVATALEDLGLENEEKIIISRKITTGGKNECRVNGKTFTLSMLKKLSAPLMDLHGQFEHQSLLNVTNHINILDAFGKTEIEPLKSKFKVLFDGYKSLLKELEGFTVDEHERERLIDLYKYQIDEIEQANFYLGEDEDLKQQHLKISHAERIAEGLNSSIKCLSAEDATTDALNLVKRSVYYLSQISSYEPKLEEIISRLESSAIEIDDISATLESLADEQYLDENEVKRIEDRLDLLSSFKKKYGSSIEEINEYLGKIKVEYEKLTNCSEHLEHLLLEKQKKVKELEKVGGELSKVRHTVATRFENAVMQELKELGMGGSKFEVGFKTVSLEDIRSDGLDDIEFLFSANIGQPTKSIVKVISGGEMSRFMLALKSITANIEGIDTMIFDEIDTGVSGQMAKVLAQKMLKVGFSHQVLCVTHMAQICAYANANFFISKRVENVSTKTYLTEISGEEKQKEVARLVGSSSSISALEHAKELIEEGKEFYKTLK